MLDAADARSPAALNRRGRAAVAASSARRWSGTTTSSTAASRLVVFPVCLHRAGPTVRHRSSSRWGGGGEFLGGVPLLRPGRRGDLRGHLRATGSAATHLIITCADGRQHRSWWGCCPARPRSACGRRSADPSAHGAGWRARRRVGARGAGRVRERAAASAAATASGRQMGVAGGSCCPRGCGARSRRCPTRSSSRGAGGCRSC